MKGAGGCYKKMENEKKIIREHIARKKKELSLETIADLSKRINNRLVQTEWFQSAKCITLYYATVREVQTSELIDAWHSVKQIVLPVIIGNTMHFRPYKGKENCHKGALGFFEPDGSEIIPPEQIDLFIVPGIAFDSACNRLGRGMGYYDRYLKETEKPIIGLCFDFQLVEKIPSEIHDKIMTAVITESTIVSPHHQ